MAWSFPKTLKRTGAPALGMFIAKSVFDVVRKEPGANVGELIRINALGFTAVWLCVAVAMFVVMSLASRLQRAR
jgi:hypothetical protein